MHQESHEPNRRGFLRTAGLAGAGAVGVSAAGIASPAAAATMADKAATQPTGARWNPDPNSLQFTLAVMPDTQFLYFAPTIRPEPQLASFKYVVDEADGTRDNVVFMAHLGDLTEDGTTDEFAGVNQTFRYLDERNVAYSVLAGNHDVGSGTNDQRGDTPYLETMGPRRFSHSPTFVGATPDGYNTAHVFTAAGRQWLLLALDWRMTAGGFDWANKIIASYPKLPVILTTHELVAPTYDDTVYPYQYGDAENNATLSSYGQTLWDGLIKGNDQIFLTLNGHFWPPGRTTMTNSAGNDVYLHITNYQNRYYGGAAMMRLYHFDLARNVIDVETVAPWILDQPSMQRNLLAAQEARLSTPVDYFSIPIDFQQRFSSFDPVIPPPPRPASELIVPGTVAYWRFDDGGQPGTAFSSGQTIKDQSGNGNDLSVLVTVPGTTGTQLTWSGDYHPDQPGHASLYFNGNGNPISGSYLTTAANAPLNTATFPAGYTFEAFIKIPLDWNASNNAWTAVLSRWGEAGQAGKSGGNTDPNEPILTLSVSNGREPQWVAYPLNLTDESTNWGQGLPEDTWWHLAVVNDGHTTVMYVEGCPTVDSPPTITKGLTQLGLPWVLGGYEYGGSINQIWHGWIGDVRIVDRALPVSKFMIS